MRALIDGDRIPYAFGGFKDDDGYPLSWGLLSSRIDDNIEQLLQGSGSDSYCVYLTADDGSNFRHSIATIRKYKGNRSPDKPFWFESIRRYLIEKYQAEVVTGIEADDALGIEQYNDFHYYEVKMANWDALGGYQKLANTIICSVDKDLDLIPGWHYNELKDEKYFISEIDAYHNFFCQLLTGDPVDNIPGLFGVGRKSKLLNDVRSCQDSRDMYLLVKKAYEDRFGSYWRMFLWENASLLWIKRKANPEGEKEVIELLKSLEAA